MDCFGFGSRKMTTFKKLPTIAPKRAAVRSKGNSGIMIVFFCMKILYFERNVIS